MATAKREKELTHLSSRTLKSEVKSTKNGQRNFNSNHCTTTNKVTEWEEYEQPELWN